MRTSKYDGGNPVMDYHPIQGGSSNTPSCFMLRKQDLSVSPMGHLGLSKGFTLLFLCAVGDSHLSLVTLNLETSMPQIY